MTDKYYFKLFPLILVIFSIIGIVNIFNNFPNYLLGAAIITFIPLGFSMALFSRIKVSGVPSWHQRITQKIPPLLLGLLVLFVSLINSTVLLPVFFINLPIGIVNTLVLSLYLGAMLQYESPHKYQIIGLKIIIWLFLIFSFGLIIGPAIKTVLFIL